MSVTEQVMELVGECGAAFEPGLAVMWIVDASQQGDAEKRRQGLVRAHGLLGRYLNRAPLAIEGPKVAAAVDGLPLDVETTTGEVVGADGHGSKRAAVDVAGADNAAGAGELEKGFMTRRCEVCGISKGKTAFARGGGMVCTKCRMDKGACVVKKGAWSPGTSPDALTRCATCGVLKGPSAYKGESRTCRKCAGHVKGGGPRVNVDSVLRQAAIGEARKRGLMPFKGPQAQEDWVRRYAAGEFD